jgi:hypothetical protein
LEPSRIFLSQEQKRTELARKHNYGLPLYLNLNLFPKSASYEQKPSPVGHNVGGSNFFGRFKRTLGADKWASFTGEFAAVKPGTKARIAIGGCGLRMPLTKEAWSV